MALSTQDSSEHGSRPPSRQSVQSVHSRTPSRDPTPLADDSSAQKDAHLERLSERGRDSSKSPPNHQAQHYYPYPPPPPHMYGGIPPPENGWARMMPPPPPPAVDRRDPRGSESPTPATPGAPGYPALGMPGYPGHQEHFPPPPQYVHPAYPHPHPYPPNSHSPGAPPHLYGTVQTSYTFHPAGVAPYGSHPAAPYGGANGNGIGNYPNGMDVNMPNHAPDQNGAIGSGAAGLAAITSLPTHIPIPESEIRYTEDAATKVTDRIRRRCYNCYTSDTSTWRRSNLAVGKVLCNKCGLFERTHARPRPEQFPHKRTSGGEGDGMSPTSPSYPLNPVTSQSHSQPPPFEREGIAKKSKKTKLDHNKIADSAPIAPAGPVSALQVPSHNGLASPSHSPLPPLPPPHTGSSSHPEMPSHSLPAGLAHLTHPHPPQHQPYYGNNGGSHSSPYTHSHTPPAHQGPTIYSGGAFGMPLQYNYPGLGGPNGGNGNVLPPIGGVGQYEYPQQHPPPRAGGVPVTGLLNGVDGRGRDSRESSISFRKGDIPIDPALSSDAERDTHPASSKRESESSAKVSHSKPSTTRSPRKTAIHATKHFADLPSDHEPKIKNQADSPESTSDYHSALSDEGSGENYTEEDDDDDDGSGTYRGSGRASRPAAKRQTRGGVGVKRKRAISPH